MKKRNKIAQKHDFKIRIDGTKIMSVKEAVRMRSYLYFGARWGYFEMTWGLRDCRETICIFKIVK
jgi:hypothetical protein